MQNRYHDLFKKEKKKGNIAYFVLDKLIIHQRNDMPKYTENDGTEYTQYCICEHS